MLLDKLQTDLTQAVKARDKLRIATLRFLLGEIYRFQMDRYPPSVGGTLTENDVLNIISKQVKSREESIDMFEKGNRQDLVDRETVEMEILMAYLPVQLDENEVRSKIEEVKGKNQGADFGTLMKLVMVELKGKADGTTVSKLVKEMM
jgi:hypothetical protein